MKAYLMHPERDFDAEQQFPPGVEALTQDLELNTLRTAMWGGGRLPFPRGRADGHG